MADLIDRDALLQDMTHRGGLGIGDWHVFDVINEQPAVNRWIPCSEKLPDSKEDVLVWFEYFRYGEYNCLYQTYGIGNYFENSDGWLINHETGWNQLRVIAWAPLPEPPEKE